MMGVERAKRGYTPFRMFKTGATSGPAAIADISTYEVKAPDMPGVQAGLDYKYSFGKLFVGPNIMPGEALAGTLQTCTCHLQIADVEKVIFREAFDRKKDDIQAIPGHNHVYISSFQSNKRLDLVLVLNPNSKPQPQP